MIVYNCNKYELPLFNTRLLPDYCGSYFWEKDVCRVVRGGERDGYGNLVLLKCFLKDNCGWFSECSSARQYQQEAVVWVQCKVHCKELQELGMLPCLRWCRAWVGVPLGSAVQLFCASAPSRRLCRVWNDAASCSFHQQQEVLKGAVRYPMAPRSYLQQGMLCWIPWLV